MTDLKDQNIKYKNWLDTSTFDNCKLNRKDYGEFLCDYITGEKEGFVLNLNGHWGAGKTEFLKRMYSELITRNYPTIYIDSWESDFTNDPLTVVSSELLTQLEKCHEDITDISSDVKDLFGKVIKGTVIGAAGMITKATYGEASVGTEFVKTLYESDNKDFMNQLKDDYSDKITAIHNIRNELSNLAEELQCNDDTKLPIVVLIDELDRCRPTYAINMLEVIKHFFNTRYFVFVVATDTTQLCESIKAVYGNNFDSKTYLKRFFNRTAELASPDIEYYLNSLELYEKYEKHEYLKTLDLFPNTSSTPVEIIYYIANISSYYQLSIRDIDQLIAKIEACLRYAKKVFIEKEITQAINIIVLIVAIIEHDRNIEAFYKRNKLLPTFELLEVSRNHSFSLNNSKLKTSLIIKLSLESISKRIVTEQGHPSTYNFLTHDKIRTYSDNNHSAYLSNHIYDIERILQKYSNQNPNQKFWLWDDYKKVVELAGNIT
ncbi:P-loop NTPase fold protein [Photobacterium carnosum]|uniref:KAP family P-loop NTPase fold protein n=1 Tax=Photobacterium carnosum TaxID=2023717 RepID=UPI001E5E2878|nr:P-loop NTPase fold protein [Photobacterium carnosum]MCD9514946.1 NTPase KAP [Photobacterium carnosum]MCD9536762.1 NTPase KAP [Photobacterium carnosum]MCF2161594.1 NTPase KAP [Photobacterium carnosum]